LADLPDAVVQDERDEEAGPGNETDLHEGREAFADGADRFS